MSSHSSSSLPPYEPQPSYLRSLMHDYHQQINAQTDATVADLQQRWVSARAAMSADIARLQRQMETAIAQGDQITYAWLSDAQRLAALKASVEGNIAQFAEGVRTLVGQGQLSAINLGTTAAQETLAATVPPGVAYTFGVPPADVLHAQAGALQAGSPLAQLFAQMGPEAAKSAQAALFTSVALGEGPRAAAARLFWNSNYTRQRAEVIARTEILRSWRGAQMENYRANSDVVSGWQWSADFSDRTCGACIAMDGTIHDLSEDLDDHIMGRCSALPITRPWSEILAGTGADTSGLTETSIASWDSYLHGKGFAADWFDGLAPEVQNSILGPAKAEAYRQGDLDLKDLAGVRRDPVWGDSIQEVSLKQLGLDAQDYLGVARANGTDSVVADAEAQAQAHAGTPAALAQVAQDAPLPQSWVDWAKTQADEWYKSVAAAIDDAGGTAAQAAEAQAQADAWYAQIERSIASGERPPAMADRAWDIRREEAIAVAEGRAEWLPAQAQMANSATEAEAADITTAAAMRGAEEIPAALAATAYNGPTEAYVQQVADTLAPRIEQYAALHPEMSVDEYKVAVSDNLQRLFADATPSVRVPSDVLDSILDDGRLKTAHEAPHEHLASGAEVYNSQRVKFEQKAFGYDRESAMEQRPISGYVTTGGADNTFAMAYGDARLVLSPDALSRSTVTFGDSLEMVDQAIPRPVNAVSWQAYDYPASLNPEQEWGAERMADYTAHLAANDPLSWNSLSDFAHREAYSDMYTEIQIHGGVSVSEIQEIQFTGAEPPNPELQRRLDEAGIKWSYDTASNPWLAAGR